MSKHKYNNNSHNTTPADISKQSGAEMGAAAEVPEISPMEVDAAVEAVEPKDAAAASYIEYKSAVEETGDAEQAKEKQRVTLSSETEDEPPELIVELSKIYDYDGEEIEKVDLSGLDSISQKDQDKVDKIYRRITKSVSSTPELTPDYGVAMTHVLTGIPLEIVKQFAFKDKIRIKSAIMRFLYGDE